MRHRIVCCFAAALTAPLALCGSAFAQCSLNTVRGAWAFQSQGTVMMVAPGASLPLPVPFASLGVMRVDGQGNYTLDATLSVGGQVQDVSAPGAIEVNPDCTAAATDSLGGAAQLVILDNGNEMRLMATSHPLGPSTGIARFRRIARGEPRCTSQMVRGVYGGSGEGTYMIPVPGQPGPVPAPFSGVFTLTFDGHGAGVGVAKASLGGVVGDVEFTEMSMTVNRDCTATLDYTGVVKQAPESPATGTIKYIVLNRGDELIGMEIESSVGPPVELESHRRISQTRHCPER